MEDLLPLDFFSWGSIIGCGVAPLFRVLLNELAKDANGTVVSPLREPVPKLPLLLLWGATGYPDSPSTMFKLRVLLPSRGCVAWEEFKLLSQLVPIELTVFARPSTSRSISIRFLSASSNNKALQSTNKLSHRLKNSSALEKKHDSIFHYDCIKHPRS